MKKSLFILLLVFLAFSCKRSQQGDEALFTLLLPSSSGVDFENRLIETEEFNII
jgi:hypothetical protein